MPAASQFRRHVAATQEAEIDMIYMSSQPGEARIQKRDRRVRPVVCDNDFVRHGPSSP